MKEVRVAFHELANKINNICIQAGAAVEIAKLKDIDSMSEDEIKQQLKKALGALSIIESNADRAGKVMSALKKKIYELLKIDTSKPVEDEE